MELTDNQKQRIQNIDIITSGIGLLGSTLGVVYSSKTGGGFWRGVGYFILGGMVFGIPAQIVALPFKNKIIAENSTLKFAESLTDIIDKLKK